MTYHDQTNTRSKLMQKINETSFAVEDILLYLDSHPCDEKAMAYFQEYDCQRREAMTEYARNYGPLTVDDSADFCGGTWKWMEQPFPWEKEGVCR